MGVEPKIGGGVHQIIPVVHRVFHEINHLNHPFWAHPYFWVNTHIPLIPDNQLGDDLSMVRFVLHPFNHQPNCSYVVPKANVAFDLHLHLALLGCGWMGGFGLLKAGIRDISGKKYTTEGIDPP